MAQNKMAQDMHARWVGAEKGFGSGKVRALCLRVAWYVLACVVARCSVCVASVLVCVCGGGCLMLCLLIVLPCVVVLLARTLVKVGECRHEASGEENCE